MPSFVDRLLDPSGFGSMVVHHRRLEGTAARWRDPARPLPAVLRRALNEREIDRLYKMVQEKGDEGRQYIVTSSDGSKKKLNGKEVLREEFTLYLL